MPTVAVPDRGETIALNDMVGSRLIGCSSGSGTVISLVRNATIP